MTLIDTISFEEMESVLGRCRNRKHKPADHISRQIKGPEDITYITADKTKTGEYQIRIDTTFALSPFELFGRTFRQAVDYLVEKMNNLYDHEGEIDL